MRRFVADQLSAEANVLKERRKGREEKALAAAAAKIGNKNKKGDKGKGEGGGEQPG